MIQDVLPAEVLKGLQELFLDSAWRAQSHQHSEEPQIQSPGEKGAPLW